MRLAACLVLGLGLVLGSANAAPPARTAVDPLDKPAFTATAKELLAAGAAAIQANDEPASMYVRRDITVSIDDRNRNDVRYRVVIAIGTADGIAAQDQPVESYRASYQDRPTIRARVISPSGAIAELDQADVVDDVVTGDYHHMTTTLPPLEVGSVIEEEIVEHDREPRIATGTARRVWVERDVPVEHTIVTISLPAKTVTAGGHVFDRDLPATAAKPKRTNPGDRVVWTYDLPRLVVQDTEINVPGDVVTQPFIGVTTGATWAQLAADYRRVLEAQLAKGAVALPAKLDRSSKRATAAALVAWLTANVKAIDVDLGDAELALTPPATALHAGSADRASRALLLVALLRAAGIGADLALMNQNTPMDIDPDLVGPGVFDHVLVRAHIDTADVWIDPAEDTAPGSLAALDYARHALVLGDATRDLVSTPLPSTLDQSTTYARTYHLAEKSGDATVTEVRHETGGFEPRLRDWLASAKPDDVTLWLQGYVGRAFKGTLVGYKVTAKDPLIVEAKDSERGNTQRSSIDVYLAATSALTDLPELLDVGGDESDDVLDATVASRTHDFQWPRPHITRIETTIVIPPGFDVPVVTPGDKVNLGTMTLTTERHIDHNNVVVTFQLDTGVSRMTPVELKDTRAAVRALYTHDLEHIIIQKTATALFDAGKITEGIAEAQRMIKLHPKEAHHLTDLADLYRRLGLGVVTRRTAKKATEVEPNSGDAWVVYAWALHQDTVGRDATFDADYAGALVALRKGLQLDPHHVGGLHYLGSWLATDSLGRTSVDPHDLLEAADALQRARAITNAVDQDTEIGRLLLIGGDFADAEVALRALPDSDTKNSLLFAAICGAHGSKAAVREAAATIADKQVRGHVMLGAAMAMAYLRHYADMRLLLASVPEMAEMPTPQREFFSKMGRVDIAGLDPKDPKTAAILAIRAAVLAEPAGAIGPWDDGIGREIVKSAEAWKLEQTGLFLDVMPSIVISDLVASADVKVTGNPSDGWRLEMDLPGMDGQQVFYAVADAKQRAVIVGGPTLPVSLGRYVHGLLAKDDLVHAAGLLDQLEHDVSARSASASLMQIQKTEHRRAGSISKSLASTMAALMVAEVEPAMAIPALRACYAPAASGPALPGGDTSPQLKLLCRTALITALGEEGEFAEVATIARTLDDQQGFKARLLARALSMSGHGKEALTTLEAALLVHTNDPDLMWERALDTWYDSGWKAARPLMEALAINPRATPTMLNNIAWAYLYADKTPDQAVVLGKQLEQVDRDPTRNVQNTFAAIGAESGDLATANKHEDLSLQPHEGPNDADLYVLARIAEAVGLRDDAIAMYKKVAPQKAKHALPAPFEFAQRNLKRMGAR